MSEWLHTITVFVIVSIVALGFVFCAGAVIAATWIMWGFHSIWIFLGIAIGVTCMNIALNFRLPS